jgi:glycosyltransferase involved in cell wall biosynthesis
MKQRLIVQTFTVPISLRFVEGQATFWKSQGFDVHFLTADGPEVNAFIKNNNAIHRVIPFKRSFSFINAFYCFCLLVKYFHNHKPNIVHGNTPNAAFLTMLAAWFVGVPIRIYEMHGLPLETTSKFVYALYWLIEKLTCVMATTVIAVSQSLREAAIEYRLVEPAKIVVNHNGSCNGIDTELVFKPTEINHNSDKQEIVIGFVGRVNFEKGIRELYEAWQMVKAKYANVKLLMVGGLDDRKMLPDEWVKKITNNDSICYVGHVENVSKYYEQMSFLVLPSYREGLGNVVLEAAAMQKPAIVARVTGLKDAVVEAKTGLFCEARSAQSLYEAIVFYIENAHHAQIHGQNARKRIITKFNQKDVWEAKLRLYQNLTTGNKPLYLPYVSPIFETID